MKMLIEEIWCTMQQSIHVTPNVTEAYIVQLMNECYTCIGPFIKKYIKNHHAS